MQNTPERGLIRVVQRRFWWAMLVAGLTGCQTMQGSAIAKRVDETAMIPLLGYEQRLEQLSAKELAYEKLVLTAAPVSPALKVRQAMLYGQPKTPLDLPKALSLLASVLKSDDPDAVSVHPLARLLATQYQERLRLDLTNDRSLAQAKEAQRRSDDLQQKLDALAAIEKTMKTRPAKRDDPRK